RTRTYTLSLPDALSIFQRPRLCARAKRLHRWGLGCVVGNLLSNAVQNSGDMIREIVRKFFVHADRPATEVDDSRRFVDAGNSTIDRKSTRLNSSHGSIS